MLLSLAFASPLSAATISGTVFEDVNYGGGAGRPLGTAGVQRSDAARVELYRPNGAFRASTTTNSSGQFSFSVNPSTWGAGQYYVRVVNGTVISERGGCTAPRVCVPVQTFRTDADTLPGTGTSTALPATNRVGGQDPRLVDAPSNTSSLTFTQLTASGQTAQSVTRVNLQSNSATVNGVDFGFNFDTIVSTRDLTACDPSAGASYFPCQGTLRQFIINSNELGGSLAQAGSAQVDGSDSSLPAGYETSIFMIPNGAANPGQNTGYANQLSAGVASIALTAALPTITDANTRLDATTQTINVGNTNAGSVGSGGVVGVDAVSFATFPRPEVQLQAGNTTVALSAAGQSVSGFALAQGYISLSGANAVARNNLVGFRADGSSDSGGAAFGIAFTGANTLIRGNYVAVNNSGIRGDNPGAGAVIAYNEVARPSLGHSDTFDGILLINNATNAQIANNLARDQRGGGIEIGFGTGTMSNVTITNNTARNNGYDSGATASSEPIGVAAYGYTGSGVVISRNRIENNAGPGLLIMAASGTRATLNSFSNNGGLAIDLDPNTRDPNDLGAPQGVTLNDSGDADSGPNGLLNFPVITAATVVNGEFSLAGFARPGSTIELYLAQVDPTGFGEGLSYVTTLTEGSSDFNAGTGSYSGAVNAVNQGADTTNRFLFRGPAPAGIAAGVVLTGTATIGGQTSEFGGNVTVTSGPNLTQLKSVAAYSDPFNSTTNPKSVPGAFQRYTVRVINQGAGVVDNNTLAIVDAVPPSTTLYVGDIGPAGSGPIRFANGATSSNLTYAFTTLNSTTDDVDFSTDGVNWNYTPVPNAQGCDPAIRHIRVRPQGTMAAAAGGNPYFEIEFRVRVE